jgi:hypothetical protein
MSEVAHLDDLEPRSRLYLRSHLDITSFGIGVYVADEPGVDVIEEHDETGSLSARHEELYLVLRGHGTFLVDGDDVHAPPGTLVFVGDPATRRKATARESGTMVLALGGVPGAAFRPGVESLAGRREDALEHLREAVTSGDERMLRLARTDEDLAPLRDDSRFEELLR